MHMGKDPNRPDLKADEGRPRSTNGPSKGPRPDKCVVVHGSVSTGCGTHIYSQNHRL